MLSIFTRHLLKEEEEEEIPDLSNFLTLKLHTVNAKMKGVLKAKKAVTRQLL